MASHVAHEVRNSLVPLTLYLSLLRRHWAGQESSAAILDKIAAGFHAFGGYREATYSSSHRSGIRPGRCFAWSLCAEVCDALRNLNWPPRGFAPNRTACPTDRVGRPADMLRRRAALNLVLNALDAMPTGRTVGDRHGGSARPGTRDRDSGPGISDEDGHGCSNHLHHKSGGPGWTGHCRAHCAPTAVTFGTPTVQGGRPHLRAAVSHMEAAA